MTAVPDMEDLAYHDLDRAQESLYYAARRYCAITEEGFIQNATSLCADHNPNFVHLGDAAHELAEAGERYSEAYARWVTCLPPNPDEPDASAD